MNNKYLFYSRLIYYFHVTWILSVFICFDLFFMEIMGFMQTGYIWYYMIYFLAMIISDGFLINFLGYCPLTVWENHFRQKGGATDYCKFYSRFSTSKERIILIIILLLMNAAIILF